MYSADLSPTSADMGAEERHLQDLTPNPTLLAVDLCVISTFQYSDAVTSGNENATALTCTHPALLKSHFTPGTIGEVFFQRG